jgi:hypothetical protein
MPLAMISGAVDIEGSTSVTTVGAAVRAVGAVDAGLDDSLEAIDISRPGLAKESTSRAINKSRSLGSYATAVVVTPRTFPPRTSSRYLFIPSFSFEIDKESSATTPPVRVRCTEGFATGCATVASTGTGVVAVTASRAAGGGGRPGWSATGRKNVARASEPFLFAFSRLLFLNVLPLSHQASCAR